MLNITKVIAPTVKTQARGKNDCSRALKWGIVCLCSFNSFEDTTKYVQKLVFQIPQFCKKVTKSLCKIAKNGKVQKITLFVFYHISNSIWATEMNNISFQSSWQIILTCSLSFDSRSNHFCVIKKNVGLLFFTHTLKSILICSVTPVHTW